MSWPGSAGRARSARLRRDPCSVGFAAETGSLDRAADKLRRKGVDLLVANDVAEAGSGFGTDTNRVIDPRRGRFARGPAAAVQARRRRPAARPGGRPAGRARRRRADWCHDRTSAGASMSATFGVHSPADRGRHRQAVRRRHAHRDADRLRLPDRPDPRRGRHPDAARRRFARRRSCSATRPPSGSR